MSHGSLAAALAVPGEELPSKELGQGCPRGAFQGGLGFIWGPLGAGLCSAAVCGWERLPWAAGNSSVSCDSRDKQPQAQAEYDLRSK